MSGRALLTAGLVVGLLSGCGGDRDLGAYREAIGEQVGMLEKVVEVLETVKDKQSMTAALPRIEELEKTERRIAARIQKLGRPPAEVDRRLQKEFGERIAAAGNRLLAEERRIRQKVDGGESFFDAIEKLKSAAQP
jgi:hypothetical protein